MVIFKILINETICKTDMVKLMQIRDCLFVSLQGAHPLGLLNGVHWMFASPMEP